MLGRSGDPRYPTASSAKVHPPHVADPALTPGPLSGLIFRSRWLQLPLYLGLIIAQGLYVFLFGKELLHLASDIGSLTEQEIMLIMLGLIDVVMISTLPMMVIVGGYEAFVSRLRPKGHPDQPEWLSHVNASVLEVKLAVAIIGISSIHLLKTFIEAGRLGVLPFCGTSDAFAAADPARAAGSKLKTCTTVTQMGVLWQTIIHTVFILSAMGIAWTDKPMQVGSLKGKAAAHPATGAA